ILVVGDLSGYIDSWVLEGHEDLTQDIDDNAGDAKSSSSSSDDGSDDEEKHQTVILGQHWIRNPAATLLPKLPSGPLVLSFRPSAPSSFIPIVNGNTAVHPTRHNPHPHSHDLPAGEDRLFILTCEHYIYEFEILRGSLSEWSRRNPTQILPAEFREVRDRSMGCLWDVNKERQRVWLYGSGWLWMFDLAKDFPPLHKVNEIIRTSGGSDVSKNNRKRKLESSDSNGEDLRKHDSGAGSKVPESELKTGIGRKIRRTMGPESTESQWTLLDAPSSPDSGEDDEAFPNTWSAVTGLRRGPAEVKPNGHAGSAVEVDDEHVTDGDAAMVVRKADEGPGWWSTYKYRPILGIVPIGAADQADGQVSRSHNHEDGPP
ncbi:MAG: U3 small nucleolar RNA-associated protein, partial [Pleopsidium flavum]